MRRRGRWSTGILSAIILGGLAWCGWRWWEVREYRNAMAEIDDAMRHGRYTAAARDLSALLAWSPGSDRALYLRGLCDKARGQAGQADAAWAAIPPDSVYHKRAVAGRVDLLIERGRLADAENLILGTTDDLGLEASALRMILIPLFVQEGRADDALRLIESRWRSLDAHGEGDVEQAVNLARLHMELRWNVPPANAVREYLDRVGRLAPDDDRIWLGRANLALRSGEFDEARRWIDDCLQRRPDDRAVWRARLNWSVRTNRLDDATIALTHLPAELATTAEGHRLSAWMASRREDVENERQELATLVAEAPEDFEAIERLEYLEKRQSAKTTAAGPRRLRAEIERDQALYRKLYRRNQPARDSVEMAYLAERLGRRFEAILFLSAALAEEPNRADLRQSLRRLEETAEPRPKAPA
jgi:enediyne biosynthesis protein E4